jgi:hypothetical protein
MSGRNDGGSAPLFLGHRLRNSGDWRGPWWHGKEFVAQQAAFVPFVATVLPAVFVLGVFTVVRLVDALVEYNQFLAGIARVRQR